MRGPAELCKRMGGWGGWAGLQPHPGSRRGAVARAAAESSMTRVPWVGTATLLRGLGSPPRQGKTKVGGGGRC